MEFLYVGKQMLLMLGTGFSAFVIAKGLFRSSLQLMRTWIAGVSSLIVVFTFVFYVSAQFQGAGNTFAASFNLSIVESVLIGATVILIYTLLGGFWAVSVTDTVQGLLMALTALLLPVAALVELGGITGFVDRLAAVSTADQLSFSDHAVEAALP